MKFGLLLHPRESERAIKLNCKRIKFAKSKQQPMKIEDDNGDDNDDNSSQSGLLIHSWSYFHWSSDFLVYFFRVTGGRIFKISLLITETGGFYQSNHRVGAFINHDFSRRVKFGRQGEAL